MSCLSRIDSGFHTVKNYGPTAYSGSADYAHISPSISDNVIAMTTSNQKQEWARYRRAFAAGFIGVDGKSQIRFLFWLSTSAFSRVYHRERRVEL